MPSHRLFLWLVSSLLLWGGCASENARSEAEGFLHSAHQEDVTTAAAGAGSRALRESPAIECDDAVARRFPGTCEPTEPDSACQACVQTKCCEEQTACNESFPDRACAFGSTLYDGRQLEGGEIGCMLECLTGKNLQTAADRTEGLAECTAACAASECLGDRVSAPTALLANCIVGLESEVGGCSVECGLLPKANRDKKQ